MVKSFTPRRGELSNLTLIAGWKWQPMGEHRKSHLQVHKETKQLISMPPEYFTDTIRPQLCSLLGEDVLQDTAIALRTGTISVNSFVLSLLSPVLRKIVCGNFKESVCKCISLDDVEESLFLRLVRLACGECESVAQSVGELLQIGALAERLQMDAVRDHVEGVVLKGLTKDSCLELLLQSEANGLQGLQRRCYNMLRDEFCAVWHQEDFPKLSHEMLENLLDEDELGIDREEDVFEALVKWMNRSGQEFRSEELFRKVRYGVFSDENFAVGDGIVKELMGEAMARKRGRILEGEWDGVERLCCKWMVARRMKGSVIGADILQIPRYVAIDSLGHILVTDSGLHQVVVFDSRGSLVRRIGSQGAAAGQFNAPKGVAVDRQGRIVVSDTYNHRIQVLNADGTVAYLFQSGRENEFEGVAVDNSEGQIVVADGWNGQIQVFDARGSLVRRFGSIPPSVLVAHYLGRAPPAEFGPLVGPILPDDAAGQLSGPCGVAVDGAGRIVVAESNNHRVQVFNVDGSVALCFGSKGDGPGQLANPHGVTVDTEGRFVVADTGNHRVQVFNADGTLERVIGAAEIGAAAGPIKYPIGVAIDGAGRIVVCEGERVLIL